MNKKHCIEFLESTGRSKGYQTYDTLDDKQKAVIAFGMTPIEVMPDKEYGKEYRKGFVLGLMDAAKANGKAVV
jgi:hypothetical protein